MKAINYILLLVENSLQSKIVLKKLLGQHQLAVTSPKMRITSFTDDFTMSVLSHIKQAAQIHTPQPFHCSTLHLTTVMPTY